jgi:glycosyltransferase involved in cell wall biosynthesis
MKINFLLPCYAWSPSGGFRVVYEYANRLVARGHEVAVIHPRRLKFPPPEKLTFRKLPRLVRLRIHEFFSQPVVNWHNIDPRVRLLYVPSSADFYIPDADVLFATAWHTARSVLECPPNKGVKCYLIQGYEIWMGPQALVDQTWRMPFRKIVIAKWLADLGHELGAHPLTYVPNGMDHSRYRVTQPIERRPRQVAMMCSHVGLKGSKDGIAALQLAKKEFPDLRVALFGNGYRPSWVPEWMSFAQDPPQQHLVEQLYNGSSIMLSPSLAEGFGFPPAEGAACGCAIVATDIGGHREFIENAVTGLLSPPRDPAALGRNLCTLLANDEIRIRLAQAANESIKKFTWERSADMLEAFAFQALERRPELVRPPSSVLVRSA